jgi:hypothetical protein
LTYPIIDEILVMDIWQGRLMKALIGPPVVNQPGADVLQSSGSCVDSPVWEDHLARLFDVYQRAIDVPPSRRKKVIA